MRTKAEIIASLCSPGIIAVVRAHSPAQVPLLSRALLEGGVIAIEITMTTPNAIECIRQCARDLAGEALIGVGTVLDEETCRAALSAGAQFVVSPICRPELVRHAREAERPIMLGAYTPTEAQRVYEAGADFVKIFPADSLGPGYIRALRAPLPHLRMVPTGGVDVGNVADFLKAGCAALGVGSSLVSNRILTDGLWPELTQKARQFVAAAQSARRS